MDGAGAFERAWVALLDSPAFRRLGGRRWLRGQGFFNLRLAKARLGTALAERADPHRFDHVETLCLFIGHNKSGTSMVGALLDAHPEVILSDEVGAAHFLAAGLRPRQVFHLLLKGSRREQLKGRVTARRLSPYSYAVPGQWQGRYSTLRVIGDGRAGATTRLLAGQPDLLPQLRAELDGVRLRFIQTIRNPFDPISVMMVRGGRSFENSIGHYFAACDALLELRRQIGVENLLAVRYEDFVRRPEDGLRRACAFLGVEPSADYLQACRAIVRPEPDRQRGLVDWDLRRIAQVEAAIGRYDFLAGYRFAGGEEGQPHAA